MVNFRPEWTVEGRINSNMETVQFREKFIDWPDKTRVIGNFLPLS
jgi:supervillin